jgi:hypothetical protein
MTKRRTRLFACLLVLLATAPEASPQTGLIPPSGSQSVVHKTGHSRSLPALNSMVKVSPVLCFQPGVGWQRVPAGQPDGPVTRDASGPVGAAHPPLLDAKLSQQAQLGECGGILTEKKKLGAGVETLPNSRHEISPSASAKPGGATLFPVHSLVSVNGSAGSNPARTMPRAMPSSSTKLTLVAKPDELNDPGDGREFHAYVSAIKLRRWIRNAPDFRTRDKLAQLGNNSETKSHGPRGDTKTGRLVSKPRASERKRGSRPCGDPMRTGGRASIGEMACHT